jgi:hypothetical protein
MRKHDAIGRYTCDTCPHWHNPQGLPIGLCLRDPPVPVMVGMAPASPLAKPGPGMDIQPVIRGYFPTVGAKDGCGQHPYRVNAGQAEAVSAAVEEWAAQRKQPQP